MPQVDFKKKLDSLHKENISIYTGPLKQHQWKVIKVKKQTSSIKIKNKLGQINFQIKKQSDLYGVFGYLGWLFYNY